MRRPRAEVSILDLARRIVALTGSPSPIRFVPYDEAYEDGFEDMMRRVPDLTKLGKLLGYSPRYDLDTTLGSVLYSLALTNISLVFSIAVSKPWAARTKSLFMKCT